MQADAEANLHLFDYTDVLPATGGAAAQAGQARAALALSPSSDSETVVTGAVSKAVHLNELRDGVK